MIAYGTNYLVHVNVNRIKKVPDFSNFWYHSCFVPLLETLLLKAKCFKIILT